MEKQDVFKSIKVADFTWAGVGPLTTRVLAEHGATVIRVESHKRPDSLRFMGPFKDGKPGLDRSAFGAAYNTGKYGISLDLNTPKGRELAEKLIMWSDVVANSFAPGTMVKWGLDYEGVTRFNPDIIYAETTMQGQWGPYKNYSAYGIHAASLAGFHEMTGWPDRGPALVYGAYTDYIGPWYLAMAIIGALDRRRKTGKGMYIEQSQLEAAATYLGPTMLDFFVNNRIPVRMGNRDPYMAPHGAFRCKGDDRWVAVSVSTDEEWRAFCMILGHPEWITSPEFSTCLARKANEEVLEKRIEACTINYTPEEVMSRMQEAGIAAGVVQDNQNIFEDPQAVHRKAFEFLDHSVIGRHAYNTPAYRLSKTPHHLKKAAPALGEDNEWVYKEILGLSDDEISELLVEGVITTEADVSW